VLVQPVEWREFIPNVWAWIEIGVPYVRPFRGLRKVKAA
jgi:hypothetical protein